MQSCAYYVQMAERLELECDYAGAQEAWLAVINNLPTSSGDNYFRAMERLARVTFKRGNSESAIFIIGSCLAMARIRYGESHAKCADLLNRLAGLYFVEGDFQRAAEALQNSMRIYEANFGREHDSWIEAAGNLAMLYERIKADKLDFSPVPPPKTTADQEDSGWKRFCDMNRLMKLCAA